MLLHSKDTMGFKIISGERQLTSTSKRCTYPITTSAFTEKEK